MTSDREPDSNAQQGWDAGWDGHSREQRRRIAKLPLWERIAWLEEAQRLVLRLRRQPEPHDEER